MVGESESWERDGLGGWTGWVGVGWGGVGWWGLWLGVNMQWRDGERSISLPHYWLQRHGITADAGDS